VDGSAPPAALLVRSLGAGGDVPERQAGRDRRDRPRQRGLHRPMIQPRREVVGRRTAVTRTPTISAANQMSGTATASVRSRLLASSRPQPRPAGARQTASGLGWPGQPRPAGPGLAWTVAVHAGWCLPLQRHGIGRALIKALTNKAVAAGCTWLHADYEPHRATFYEDRLGLPGQRPGFCD
jgi:hypothetical protein